MKKVVTLALLGATSSLMALGGEFASLYKDPRVMGMGGANVAVGAYSSSVFSNPAGLTNIKKDHGFVVDILSLGVSTSEKVGDFASDLDDAGDDDTKIFDVLDKYSGEAFSISASNYSSISKNSDAFAWSIGLLAASDATFTVHGNGSTSGSPIEAAGRGYGGLVLGAAKPYNTKYGRLDVGMSMKYIVQNSYEGPLYVSDLQGDDVGKTLQDTYEKESSGFGVDIGVTYHPFVNSKWHPAFGLSILNIGAMEMDNNYGGQPMSVNVGASVTPEVPFLSKLVLAVDYVDMFNANTIRVYDYPSTSNGTLEVAYTDYEDTDMMKRLRLGMGIGLVDSTYFSTTVNVGLYQGAYTAGLDMELTILKLNFATYEEQIGTGSVDISDRRYMAQIGIGW